MIARLEVRTEEATELRIRLELTEKPQSTEEAQRNRLLERVRELEAALGVLYFSIWLVARERNAHDASG
jgi:hypothetical protein